MANFPFGLSYEVTKRRDEYFGSSFDDLVGNILELERALEEMTEERDALIQQVADLEQEQ